MFLDMQPRFALSHDLMLAGSESIRVGPEQSQTPDTGVQNSLSIVRPAILQALFGMAKLANTFNSYDRSADFWRDSIGAFRIMAPQMHCLLSLPRLLIELDAALLSSEIILAEMIRLTCLLLLAALKERLGFGSPEILGLRAKMTRCLNLKGNETLGGSLRKLKAWVLVINAELEESSEAKEMYLKSLNLGELSDGVNGSRDIVIAEAKGFVWFRALETDFNIP